MTDLLVPDAPPAAPHDGLSAPATAHALQTLLEERRSIRRLRGGPFPPAARQRILEAVRLTPASYNLPPWRVVLVADNLDALYAEIAAGFRESLDGDRLERYLERLQGFAGGVAVALVFVDTTVEQTLRDEKGLAATVAAGYVQQALGMVQYALWLAVTAEGLATSLQHWDEFAGPRLTRFAALPADRFTLIATMPIGYPAEDPRPIERARSGWVAPGD